MATENKKRNVSRQQAVWEFLFRFAKQMQASTRHNQKYLPKLTANQR